MTGIISGIWGQIMNTRGVDSSQSLRAAATGDSTVASDTGQSANISANDFLTLLVTEMKNQDPTANTDPNEYINQLVQVNSLEQLISINQTLTSDSVTASTRKENAPPGKAQALISLEPGPSRADVSGITPALVSQKMQPVPGNLTFPTSSAAARTVSEALSRQVNR
jgi:flagellar basal-body rod modification protein FlgD